MKVWGLFMCIFLYATCQLSSQNISIDRSTLDLIRCNSVIELSDGGFAISGYNSQLIGDNPWPKDPGLQLTDNEGMFLDSISFEELEELTLISEKENGRFLCIGSPDNLDYNFYTVKGDLTNLQLKTSLTSNQNFIIKEINSHVTKNDELIVDGIIEQNNNESRVLLSYNTNTLALSSMLEFPELEGSIVFSDDTYFHISQSNNRSTLSQYDSDAELLWIATHPYLIYDVITDDQGFIYCGASQRADDPGDQDAIIIKLNNDGSLHSESESISVESTPQFWPEYHLSFTRLALQEDGLVAVGIDDYNRDVFPGSHNFIVAKFDYDLVRQEFQRVSTTGVNSTITDIIETDDNIYVIANTNSLHFDDTFLFDISLGSITSSADDQIEEQDLIYYPNPVTDNLKLEIEKGSHVMIHSLNGTLLLQESYDGNVRLENLPSGIYILSYEVDRVRQSIKIIKN